MNVTNRYRTIVADPPWKYDRTSRGFSWREGAPSGEATAMLNYPTMTLDEIAALPVADLAKDDAFLFLWTTHRYVWDAPSIVVEWGFKPSKLLTWCKPPTGFSLGGTFGNSSEFVLYARRGKPKPTNKVPRDWWEWSRGQHSAKPEAFLDLVEQVCPGPYLEMFARRNRLGWDTWGNECFEHVAVGGRKGQFSQALELLRIADDDPLRVQHADWYEPVRALLAHNDIAGGGVRTDAK